MRRNFKSCLVLTYIITCVQITAQIKVVVIVVVVVFFFLSVIFFLSLLVQLFESNMVRCCKYRLIEP